MNRPNFCRRLVVLGLLLLTAIPAGSGAAGQSTAGVYPLVEQVVDANGVLLYTVSIGSGAPLVVLHGGPGASHDYFLPYLLPLARHHRLIFLDERGSGRSEKLDDPAGYTVEAMVADVEAVRQALGLGRIALLGHSFGGVLAQAYALAHPEALSHLVLCSTFHSTRAMNEVFREMKAKMPAELRARIEKQEAAGLYGQGKAFEQRRYPSDYMTAAWGEGYFPYLYGRRPDPNFDPAGMGAMSWDLYREMWGSSGEFVIDGNLVSVEYADKLGGIRVPTLVTVGDHDQCDPSLAREMQRLIPGAKLLVLPDSGHMTFVDQPALFVREVDAFLRASARAGEEPRISATAKGSFSVELEPAGEPSARDGVSLGRVTLAKLFTGDLAGSAQGEMLTALTPVGGSAGYVALERVSGSLQGRTGSFVLQHGGTMTRGDQQLSITIVPDSGTGDLTGIAGVLRLEILEGSHRYELEYTLPAGGHG